MMMGRSDGQKGLTYLFAGMVGLVLVMSVYFNLNYPALLLNTDSAAEMDLAKCVFQHKALIPVSFANSAEIMVNRPTVVAALFYGLSGNWLSSYLVTIILFGFLDIFLFYKMARAFGFSRMIALCGILMLVGFYPVFSEFSFLGSYFYSLIFSVIFFTGYAYARGGKWRKIALVLAVWMGFASLRMMAWLYLPLLIVTGCYFVWKRDSKQDVRWACGLAALNGVGYLILKFVVVPYLSIDFAMAHVSVAKSIGDVIRFAEQFWGMFCQGMALEGVPASSVGHWILLVGACAVFFIFRKEMQCLSSKLRPWCHVLVVSALIICMAGILTPVTAYFYFFTLWLFVILMWMVFLAWLEERQKSRVIALLGIFIFLWGWCYSISYQMVYLPVQLSHAKEQKFDESDWEKLALTYKAKDLLHWLRMHQVRDVYVTFWDAAPLKVFDNDKTLHVKFLPAIIPSVELRLENFVWLIDKDVLRENRNPDGRTYIALTPHEEEILTPDARDLLSHAEKVADVSGWHVYSMKTHAFDFFEMPRRKGETERCSFTLPIFHHSGMVTEDGILAGKNGEKGFVVWGPYLKISKGTYDFTFRYTCESSEAVGNFDIAGQQGNEVYAKADFHSDAQEVTFHDVNIPQGKIELRCFLSSGTVLFREVEIKKVR